MTLKDAITLAITRGYDSPSALIDYLRNGPYQRSVPTNNNNWNATRVLLRQQAVEKESLKLVKQLRTETTFLIQPSRNNPQKVILYLEREMSPDQVRAISTILGASV